MDKNQVTDIGQFSTLCAFVSCIIGTFFFVCFYFFDIESCIYGGIIYLFFATIANLIVLLRLFYFYLKRRDYRRYLANKMLILLANIPVAIGYYILVVEKTLSTSPF